MEVAKSCINRLLTTEVWAEADGFLWFVPLRENALYRMNLANGALEYVTRFEREASNEYLFAKMFSYKGKLFLIPGLSGSITVYEMASGQKIYLDYKRNYKLLGGGKRFATGVVKDNYLYLIPGQFREIVCVNMDNLKMEFCDISEGETEKGIGSQKGIDYSFKNVEIVGNDIYIPSFRHAGILIYSMEKQSYNYIYPDDERTVYEGIFQIDHRYLLIPKSKNYLYVWNKEADTIEKRLDLPADFVPGIVNFYYGKIVENKLYLLQWYGNMSFVIDLETMKIEKLNLPECEEKDSLYKWIDICMYMGNLCVISGANKGWYQVKGTESTYCDVPVRFCAKSLAVKIDIEGILLESDQNVWGLKDYLDMLSK